MTSCLDPSPISPTGGSGIIRSGRAAKCSADGDGDWRKSYPGDVLQVLNNGEPSQVYLFQTPSGSANGLWTYSGYTVIHGTSNRRLTLNLGLRFDRYRVFLPEETHPAGRFTDEAQTFAAVDNVIDWNVIVPRIGVIYELPRDGKSLVKFSYGHYSFAPGSGFNANANTSVWWKLITWDDSNLDDVWQLGEETGLPLDSRGGTSPTPIDPSLKLPLLKEIGGWFEREFPGNIGLRTGIVWRGERQHFLRQNAVVHSTHSRCRF